ncbi:dermonecrotic toxin domain-containing protein [Pseudomonas kurunegalensis]|uniref:dermonecrotic toxin domain-containing protein n=1 Tax=Pseudomonas kurunegalensis TaxID=485880 RepID=UPI002118BE2F
MLRQQLGYWLDPDTLYWHEFQSAASSSHSYTGWCHRGPPQRSLSLIELVIQRFSPQQQTAADELSVYGGFYRVDASHGDYDERNEVRLDPQAMLKAFWQMDFAGRYSEALSRFREQCGEDYCVLARARFLAVVGQSVLSELERRELLAATLRVTLLPSSLKALREDYPANARGGWRSLSSSDPGVRPLFLYSLKTGRQCVYLPDAQNVLVVFDDRATLQAWIEAHVASNDTQRQAVVGDLFIRFTSFTENPYALWEVFNDPQTQVSGKGAFGDNALVYVLEPGEDVQAMPIGPFSRRPDEAESLMMPGRYLQVEKLTPVKGDNHRFMEVCLKALARAPEGARVREMRTGALFNRQVMAERLGVEDDGLMRTFFALPT